MTSKEKGREEAKTLLADRLPDSTHEERDAIIDLVYAESATKGIKIGFIGSYINGRLDGLLEQDLAQVRRYSAAPPMNGTCSEHDIALTPGRCSSCEGDMAAGDFEVVRRILDRDGADARPDLARRLGAPRVPELARSGHVPYGQEYAPTASGEA